VFVGMDIAISVAGSENQSKEESAGCGEKINGFVRGKSAHGVGGAEKGEK